MRSTSNWNYDEIVQFLRQNGFKEINVKSSHHYFGGEVDGNYTVVEVQYHANVNGMIKPGTFRDSIIVQSRIPAKEWYAYTKLSPSLRKKYRYKGCAVPAKQ